MKVTIANEYFDKNLNRNVKVGEILDLDEDRIEQLKSNGINVGECNEDECDEDDEDECENLTLVESYTKNKNIVDTLLAPDLKLLCEHFKLTYTNVADAKEALKILTLG